MIKSIPKFSGNPQSKLDTVIKMIEKGLNAKTFRVKPPEEHAFYDPISSDELMILKASEDVREVRIDEFSKIMGNPEEGIAGSYCTKTGKIFLIKNEWCISNLIHEALHSRSTFSKISPPPKNLEFIYEGITELLVGLVLKRGLPRCCAVWQSIDSCFLEPYKKFVKSWLFLSSRIDFSPITTLFFDVQESEPYVRLGQLLQEFCDARIESLFRNYDPWDYRIFDRFLDELGESFPMDFAEFQRAPLVRVDLDHLG